MMLDEAGQALIAAAVSRAVASTSAEVGCVVTGEVSQYREVSIATAAAVALLAPPLAVALGLRLEALAAPFSGWTAAHGPASGPALTLFVVLQVVVFGLAALVASVPSVRRTLTPRSLKERRVRRAAQLHFAGARHHLEAERPLLLIFASPDDRQMEIIADEQVHARVGQAVWDDAVAQALATIRTSGTAAGLARAVEVCGAAVAAQFPDDGAPNAFPDRAAEV